MLTDAEATRVVEQVARLPFELRRMASDPLCDKGIAAMWSRRDEFDDHLTAVLAGMAIYQPARALLEEGMNREFSKRVGGYDYYDEVVIGSGVHAATYAMSRARLGYPTPLIISDSEWGGTFAYPKGAAFYLNSRNRPGDTIALPGSRGPLNLLPGGVIQPSDIGGQEYQTNDDLAFVVRMNLIMSGAEFMHGRVGRIVKSGTTGYVILDDYDDAICEANRVIIATGLGRPKYPGGRVDNTINIMQFLARMTQDFPLRGIRRAAVIGAKDSGNIAVEALLGQGPGNNSVGSLDYVERIDWFGQNCTNALDYRDCCRSRYDGISRYMPRDTGEYYRVNPVPGKTPIPQVQSGEYDLIVVANGFENNSVRNLCSEFGAVFGVYNGNVQVASRVGLEEIYAIGPASNIPVSAVEKRACPVLSTISENSAAIFRYAQRVADFAFLSNNEGPQDELES